MVCLSQEELAQLALGQELEADESAHLGKCGNCQADLVRLRSLTDQLSAAHNNLHRGHEEARVRLLTNLPEIDRQTNPVISWKTPSFLLEGLNMKQRIALCSLSVATVMGLMIVWAAISARPLSAMEQMSESIGKATSCKGTTEIQLRLGPGAPSTISSTSYWLASGSTRIDVKGDDGLLWYIDATYIHPAGEPGVEITHTNKEFRRGRHAVVAENPTKVMKMLQGLSKYSGAADRKLGTKTIDGRKTLGFRIDTKEIDVEDYIGAGYFGFLEVWLDAETNLPLEVRMEMKNAWTQKNPITAKSESFQWNVELDAKLFDPTPPDGYLDNTPEPPTPKGKQPLHSRIGAKSPAMDDREASVNDDLTDGLTMEQLITHGEQLSNHNSGPTTVRFLVRSAKRRKMHHADGRTTTHWILSSAEETGRLNPDSLEVRISQQAEAALEKLDITDIPAQFIKKTVTVRGRLSRHVARGGYKVARKFEQPTTWIYGITLNSLDQLINPDLLEQQAGENKRM